jgi:hypothetical protein
LFGAINFAADSPREAIFSAGRQALKGLTAAGRLPGEPSINESLSVGAVAGNQGKRRAVIAIDDLRPLHTPALLWQVTPHVAIVHRFVSEESMKPPK